MAIHFDVQLSEPYSPSYGHQSMRNVSLDVITTSAQRAIELALAQHPEGNVHVVQRRGSTNLLFDPDIVKELLSDE